MRCTIFELLFIADIATSFIFHFYTFSHEGQCFDIFPFCYSFFRYFSLSTFFPFDIFLSTFLPYFFSLSTFFLSTFLLHTNFSKSHYILPYMVDSTTNTNIFSDLSAGLVDNNVRTNNIKKSHIFINLLTEHFD